MKHLKRVPEKPGREASAGALPSEVLFGFVGWLTTREERVVFSAYDDASPAAELVAAYCKAQGLEEPRHNFTDYLAAMDEDYAIERGSHAESGEYDGGDDHALAPSSSEQKDPWGDRKAGEVEVPSTGANAVEGQGEPR